MGGKVQGIRSINGRYNIDREVNCIANGEAKELICMTPGYELGCEMLVGGGV